MNIKHNPFDLRLTKGAYVLYVFICVLLLMLANRLNLTTLVSDLLLVGLAYNTQLQMLLNVPKYRNNPRFKYLLLMTWMMVLLAFYSMVRVMTDRLPIDYDKFF